MREIKFRAWDKTNKAMYFKGDSFGTTHDIEPLIYLMQGQNVEVMQYTGLKDKNGVEIYDGDIVGRDESGHAWSVEWGCFGDTGFYGYNQLNSCRRLEPCRDGRNGSEIQITEDNILGCEVIGTIYENPELLEVVK